MIDNNILYNMVEKKCFAMFCQKCQFFGCTPRLKKELLDSNDLKLAEAGLDLFYGIGLTMSSSDIFDPAQWKGQNNLERSWKVYAHH